MPINFPNTPTLNQVYTANTRSWTWNGNAWQLTTPVTTGPTGPSGASGAPGANGAPGASGVPAAYLRTTATGSGSINNLATASFNVTGFKGYTLYKIQTSAAAWVRIYSSDATRTADAARLQTVDPASDAGLIAEVITTGSQTVTVTPAIAGFNDEASPTTNIPMSVTNLSGTTASISITLTLLQTEA
jgi:hypothetical protein